VRTWDYSFPYVLIYFHLSSHLHFSSRRSFIFLSNCDYGVFWWVALVIIGGTFILSKLLVASEQTGRELTRYLKSFEKGKEKELIEVPPDTKEREEKNHSRFFKRACFVRNEVFNSKRRGTTINVNTIMNKIQYTTKV
jgi:hypothetical protein